MKLRKTLSMVLICVLCLAFLLSMSGCGGQKQNESSDPTTSSKEVQTEEVKETKDEQKPVEIKVGHWLWRPENIEKITGKFNSAYPNIKISYEFMEYPQYTEKLKVNLAAGNAFDAFVLSADILPVSKAYCEPLASFAEKAWGKNYKEKFISGAFDAVEMNDIGIIGIPSQVGYAGMLYYNVDKLQKYNLSVPKTYEELKNFSGTLVSNGDLPAMIGAKDTWIILDLFNAIANDMAPGKVYKADRGEIPWSDPDLIKAFEAWKGLFADKIFQEGALGLPQYPTTAEMYWQKGKGGALFDGDWAVGTFTVADTAWSEPANKYKQTVAPFPDMNGDGKPCPVLADIAGIWSIYNKSTDEKKEAAWKLIEWYAAGEGLVYMNSKDIGVVMKPAFLGIDINFESDVSNYNECMKEIMKFSSNVGGDRELKNANAKKVLGEVLQELAAGADAVKSAEKVDKAMKE